MKKSIMLFLQGEFCVFYRKCLIVLIFLSGCTTSKLWDTPAYNERVTGFFGVKDKNLLIVEGDKYSYVFEANQQFKDVLTASRIHAFIPKYKKFKLDVDGNVTGTLSLVSYRTADINELTRLAFTKNKDGDMQIDFELKGKRYIVEGSFPFEKLGDRHYVSVETPESNIIATAGKIVVTPATVTIDALMVIPVVAMYTTLVVMIKTL